MKATEKRACVGVTFGVVDVVDDLFDLLHRSIPAIEKALALSSHNVESVLSS